MRDYYRLFSSFVSRDNDSNIKRLFDAFAAEYHEIFTTLDDIESAHNYQTATGAVLDEYSKGLNLNRGERTDVQLRNLITANLIGLQMSDDVASLQDNLSRMPGVSDVVITPQRDDVLYLDGSWKLDGSEMLDAVRNEDATITLNLDSRHGVLEADLQSILNRAVSLGAGRGITITTTDIDESEVTGTIPANSSGHFFITVPASGLVEFVLSQAPTPNNVSLFVVSLVDDVNSGSIQQNINPNTLTGSANLLIDAPRAGQTAIEASQNSNHNAMNFPNGRYQYFYVVYFNLSQSVNFTATFTKSI